MNNTIHHHPDDATLMAYAAGSLTEGFNLVVAAHLELCPRCRRRAAEAETVGGELLQALPEEAVPNGGLAQVWQLIDQVSATEQTLAPPSSTSKTTTIPRRDGMPRVLEGYLPQGLAGVNWRLLAPGIRQHVFKQLDSGAGAVRLFAIAPGTSIPQHSHTGSEMTLILKGSYGDEIGRFCPGDLADLDDTVKHQPVADTAEACICLIATDDKLKFSNVLSRMLQPLIGI
jgi:putative transcriptional regulator